MLDGIGDAQLKIIASAITIVSFLAIIVLCLWGEFNDRSRPS
jgi:hypothetical protein